MANNAPNGPIELGAKMDYAEHEATYSRFIMLAKYGAALLRGAACRHGLRLLHQRRLLFGHHPPGPDLRDRLLRFPLVLFRQSGMVAEPSAPRPCRDNPGRKDLRVGQTIFVAKEVDGHETRVAASPDTVKRLVGTGLLRDRRSGCRNARRASSMPISSPAARRSARRPMSAKADVVLKVRRPTRCRTQGLQVGRRGARHHGSLRQRRRAGRHGQGRRHRLRHGIHAAHHARAGRWTCCPARPISPATRR